MGERGSGEVEKSVTGGQAPAVGPNKGSNDQAQGTIVVLCPEVLSPLMSREALAARVGVGS